MHAKIRLTRHELHNWREQNTHIPADDRGQWIKEHAIDILFSACSIPSSTLTDIRERWPERADRIILTDPFRLYAEIDGITFQKAFRIWRRTSDGTDRNAILKAAAIAALDQNERSGHSYMDRDTLIGNIARYSGETRQESIAAYHSTVASGAILEYPLNGITRTILRRTYREEAAIARLVKARRKIVAPPPQACLIEDVCRDLGLPPPDTDQAAAIRTSIANHISVITGPPGTGKTAMIRIIAELCHRASPDTQPLCLSLPARIARSVHERTGLATATIHKALEYTDGRFEKGKNHPLAENLIFLDEAFMIGNSLLRNLLEALPPAARLVMIGDSEQIEPVGRGAPLAAIVRSGLVPTSTLTTNHRSGAGSTIPASGRRVMNGRLPIEGSDLSISSTFTHAQTIREAVRLWQAAAGRYGSDNVHVLAARHDGPCGTRAINDAITGRDGYSVGDRVMQLRNDHEKDIFNGETGTIRELSKSRLTIVTDAGSVIEYHPRNLASLTKAYCITFHKAQGLEFAVAILVLDPDSAGMLSRNMLNVGITRARTKCHIIDQRNQLAATIAKTTGLRRRTMISELIKGNDPVRRNLLARISATDTEKPDVHRIFESIRSP